MTIALPIESDTSFCPYCGGVFPAREMTDHVFLDALGGHAVVLACGGCNNTIGHQIEGPLQQGNQLLNLAKLQRGTAKPIRGRVVATGELVQYDLARGGDENPQSGQQGHRQ